MLRAMFPLSPILYPITAETPVIRDFQYLRISTHDEGVAWASQKPPHMFDTSMAPNINSSVKAIAFSSLVSDESTVENQHNAVQ